MLLLFFALLSTGAALGRAWVVAVLLGGVALLLALRMFEECANALMTLLHVLKQPERAMQQSSSGLSGRLEAARRALK